MMYKTRPGTRLCILLALFIFCVQPSLAVFERWRPPRTENFDPAEADPQGNITCEDDGDLAIYFPDILASISSAPRISGLDYLRQIFTSTLSLSFNSQPIHSTDIPTVQQLCAKPQYGGLKGVHVGGFCDPNQGVVTFDNSRGARASALQSPRVLLYCKSRCFCSWWESDLIQLSRQESLSGVTATPDTQTHTSIQVEKKSWLASERSGDPSRRSLRVPFISQVKQQHRMFSEPRGYRVENLAISLAPENDLDCDGPTPHYEIPILREWSRLANTRRYQPYPPLELNDLCRISILGGMVYNNAGGYCHNNDDGTRDVWFTDEMTPNPLLRWNNFRVSPKNLSLSNGDAGIIHLDLNLLTMIKASMSIRYTCWRHCRCKGDKKKPNVTESAWHFLENVVLRDRLNDEVYAQFMRDRSSAASADVIVKPAGSAAGTCGADGKQFCNTPWPTNVFGPRPTAPIKIPSVTLDTCGQSCTSNDDCSQQSSSSNWDAGCRCVVPKLDYIPDPVFPASPVGRCLVITAAILSHSGSLIGKRHSELILETKERDTALATRQANITSLSDPSPEDESKTLSNSTNTVSANLNVTLSDDDVDNVNTTINTTAWDDYNVDDYATLPSISEIIVNENPPWNLTSWVNETSLEVYNNLDSLPSYLWCACNCTYTSWGCCITKTGIVYENPAYNKGAIGNCSIPTSTPQAKETLTNTVSSTAVGSSQSPIPSDPVCTTKCRSTVRACQVGCKCRAPPVGLFFWFQGACGPRHPLPKRALLGQEHTIIDSSHQHLRRDRKLSVNSTARELLGRNLTSMEPKGYSTGNGSLLGYKATMDMIPDNPVPAPCNESYISFACADSIDGIVHEGPEFWLGALLPENVTDLPPVPETWLRINGLDDTFNTQNRFIT